jgi:metallophosphoesterase superfamily enzyme
VARLLLLTDLHIGRPGMDAAGSDYSKSRMLPASHQRRRQEVLRDTTTAIAAEAHLLPDALVVAGDVTYRDDRDGWTHLSPILEPLREAGLDDGRIVITPGNHDVTRNLAVDDPAHYEHYLAGIGDDWVSPLLDGRDIDDHGHPKTTEGKYLLLPEHDSSSCRSTAATTAEFGSRSTG